MEIWLPIEGFESLYLISSYGRIKSLKNNIYLKGDKTKLGYIRVTLHNKGKKSRISIHRLVGLHFLKNSYTKKKNIINHKDCNPSNNKVENLEWTDFSGNAKHALISNRLVIPKGTKNGMSVLKDEDIKVILTLRQKGLTQKEIGDKFKVSRSCIAHITQGNRWKHLLEK